jgi:hypothetical protein
MLRRAKSCLKTSILAGAPIRLCRTEGVFRRGHPVRRCRRRGGRGAAGPPELGPGESFSQLRAVSGREQDQPVQDGADRRPAFVMPQDVVGLCFLSQIELEGSIPSVAGNWQRDGCRRWQAGRESPHGQPDAPTCRKHSSASWSAPDIWVGEEGLAAVAQTEGIRRPSTTGPEADLGSNIVLTAFLA